MMPKRKIILFGANGKVGKPVLLGLLQEAKLADDGNSNNNNSQKYITEAPFTVQAVVRSKERMMEIPPEYTPHLEVIEASILEEGDAQKIQQIVQTSNVTISCLGHGKNVCDKEQASLLLDSTKLLYGALTPANRLICLNGAAARHPGGYEARSWGERRVLSLLSWAVPAHADMERTLEYLYEEHQSETESANTEQNKHWIVVRPGLFKEDADGTNKQDSPATATPPSCTYSFTKHREVGLFSGRVCSVSNVADSIVKLAINDNNLQNTWDRQMPVVLDDVDG